MTTREPGKTARPAVKRNTADSKRKLSKPKHRPSSSRRAVPDSNHALKAAKSGSAGKGKVAAVPGARATSASSGHAPLLSRGQVSRGQVSRGKAKRKPENARASKPSLQPQKLHKLLAQSGLTSRRQANSWLEAGRVTVQGRVAEPWISVLGNEDIRLDNLPLKLAGVDAQPSRVLLYNKAAGEICSRLDKQGRTLVFDQLPSLSVGRWVSVGRLDFNTTGLLLFTNDGALANKLMHPSTGLDREYAVRVLGHTTDKMLANLRTGVMLEDGLARFSDVRFYGGTGANRWYHVVLMEGRKHQVKKLWESQGVRISRLKRVRFGPVVLPSTIRSGQRLELKPVEVAALYQLVGLKARLTGRQSLKAGENLQKSKVLIPYQTKPGQIKPGNQG